MLKPKNAWPDSGIGKAVLFVAQSMHELLNNEKQPSFRVKSLDLVGLLREAIRVCQDVEAAGVDRRNAQAVLDELECLIKTDPVANRLMPSYALVFSEAYQRFKDKRFSLGDLVHHLNFYIKALERRYKSEIEQYIIDNYKNDRNRLAVKSALSSYLSHLIAFGYTQEFLLTKVEEKFFSGDLKKVETRTITRFFAQFTMVERPYVVWALAPRSTGNFLRKLGTEWPQIIGSAAVPADVGAWVGRQLNLPFTNAVVISGRYYAYDPYTAVSHFNDQMRRARSLTALVQAHVILRWSFRQYVRSSKSNVGVSSNQFHSSIREFRLDASGGSEFKVRGQARKISRYSHDSQERIFTSLQNGKNAKDSLNGEQSIISVWSSFEILIRNPSPGVVRINHYKDALLPILCLRYAKHYVMSSYIALRSVDRAIVDNAVAVIASDRDDPLFKFSLMMFVAEYSEAQKEFFGNFGFSPLAQFHIWNIRRKFLAPKDYLKSLEEHEQRVAWQIERIYRTRNQIIHAGLREVYLESLGRNANEYFRAAMGPLLHRGRFGDDLDVDNILAEFSLEYMASKHRLRTLASDDAFTIDGIVAHFQ